MRLNVGLSKALERSQEGNYDELAIYLVPRRQAELAEDTQLLVKPKEQARLNQRPILYI
jgi:hypothetical protein